MSYVLGVNLPEALCREETLISWLGFFKSIGISSLEISPCCFNIIRGCHLDHKALQALLDILSPFGFKYTLHAPNEVNLAEPTLHRYSLRILRECLEMALRLGTRLVVMHTGYILPPKSVLQQVYWSGVKNVTYREPCVELKEQALRLLIKGLRALHKDLEDYGVILALENGDLGITHLCRRVEEIERVIRETRSDYVKMTLDLAHLYISSKALDFDFLASVRRAIPMVVHIHLSDNYGVYHPAFPDHNLVYGFGDLHLPIGWGNIPFGKVFEIVRSYYKGVLLIEVDPTYGRRGYIDSVKALRKLIEGSR